MSLTDRSESGDSAVNYSTVPTDTMHNILNAAKIAVRRASLVAVRVREQLGVTDKAAKMDASPVTVGDYACQIVVIETLKSLLYSLYPSYPPPTTMASSTVSSPLLATFRMVGEEDTESLKEVSSSIHQRILTILNSSFPRSLLQSSPSSSSSSPSSAWTFEHIQNTLSLAGYKGGGNNSYWILDPIDGTKGYLRGGQYAIGLAFVMHGEVVLSVIGCPSLPYPSWSSSPSSNPSSTLFTALKGKGAWMEPLYIDQIDPSSPLTTESSLPPPQSLRTSSETDFARLVLAESFEKSHSNHELSAHIGKEIGLVTSPAQLDSMCKYGLLSRGDVHIYLRFPPPMYNEKVWDHAPGSLLCTEAGGIVTDCEGKPLDFSIGRSLSKNYGIVAANNSVVHARILQAIKSYGNKKD